MASEDSFSPSKESVLSKAALNAAKYLGLSHAELAKLLGTSEVAATQLAGRERFLDPSSHEGERALMLVHIFRTLDVLVGGDEDAHVTWMNAHNQALGDLPKHAIQMVSGLECTLTYLKSLVGRGCLTRHEDEPPLSQAQLCQAHSLGRSQAGKPVEDGCTDLLSLEVASHHPLTQPLEAAHLGFH